MGVPQGLAGGWEVGLLLVMLAIGAILVVSLFLLNRIHHRRTERATRLEGMLESLVPQWTRQSPSPEEVRWLSRLPRPDRTVLFRICCRTLPDLEGDAVAQVRNVLQRSGLLDQEVARLRHRDWGQRADACHVLGRLGHASAIPALVARLHDSNATVRQQAVGALGDLRAVEALDAMVDALDRFQGWGNLLAIMALSRMGPAAAPRLGALLGASNSPARTKALLQVTAQLGIAADPGLIRALARHPEAEVRIEAVRTLGHIAPEPESIAICLDAMEDPEWPTRALAARSLGRLGGHQAVVRLEQAMGDSSYWVRHHSGEALTKLGDTGKAALARSLNHANRFVRDMAAQVDRKSVV